MCQFQIPKKALFKKARALYPSRIPNFRWGWLIWAPNPTYMSPLRFRKKSNLHLEYGSFFKFVFSPSLCFGPFGPVFGYSKPDFTFLRSCMEGVTQFHKLAADLAQNRPLTICLEAICDFFNEKGHFLQFSPFSPTLSSLSYDWVKPSVPIF